MKTNILFVIITALTILTSCHSKEEEHQSYGQGIDEAATSLEEQPGLESKVSFGLPAVAAGEEVTESANLRTEAAGEKSSINKNKIIKDGNMSVKTNRINASKKSIDDLLKKLNAYYESEDLQNNDQTISYGLKIRVPAENFEKLISCIENGKDEIKSKSIQARDVTEEYVDIETRLENKREYVKRYKELLSKASTINDILAIESNIRILEEEIESKEGRLKYLNDQISFSTLYINLYQDKEFIYKPQTQDNFSERVKKSLSNGWTSVVEFALWTITGWPYLILILTGFWIIRRVIKKRKSREAK